MKICAIVVTFNRLELLKQTLNKLMNQSYKLEEIIVVNNCSNDGTIEFLQSISDKITIINLDKNIGGAGGFYKGLKKAYEKKYDYYWLMDDDTFTTETSLQELINGLSRLSNKKIGFLCSNVLYKDNKPCIMNIPCIDNQWNEYVNDGIIELMSASFVSLMISREAIDKVGLPIKEFFIWGDDVEYTQRISKEFDCYMIGKSIVYHYMNENKGTDIITDSSDRIERYFYKYRNLFFISKRESTKNVIKYIISVIITIYKIIVSDCENKLRKIFIIIKGIFKGITFNPRIENIN